MADRKISDLTALTTPAAGDYLPIVDISEVAASSKNKRITIEELLRGAPDGTAAAPSIGFESDPNTGIYSPGADQLAISTNGTGRLFVDASGNVGFGQASPTSIASYTILSVNNTAGGAVYFQSSGTLKGRIINTSTDFYIGGASGTPLILEAGGSEKARITSAGTVNIVGAGTAGSTQAISFNGSAPVNSLVVDSSGRVGIGTSSPGARLHSVETSAAEGLRIDGAAGGFSLVVEGGTTRATRIRQATIGNSYGGNTPPTDGLLVQGSVGIGTTSANSVLQVNSGTNLGGILVGFNLGSSNFYDADLQVFRTGNGTERARIDSSGRLLVGTSSARSNFYNDTNSAFIQLESASNDGSALALVQNFNANTLGGQLILAKSNATSVGSNTLVANNDTCGRVSFQGNDGAQFVEAAAIFGAIDGTPGANDMPGRLVFSTTADGASSPTERMRITSAGLVGIGTSSVSTKLEIAGNNDAVTENNTLRFTDTDVSTEANQQIGKIEFYSSDASTPGAGVKAYIGAFAADTTPDAYLAFATQDGSVVSTPVERVRITSDGKVGIGATSDAGSSKLFVAGDATAGLTNIVTLRTASANSYGLQIQGSNTNDEWRIQNYYNAALAFGTSNTERARIDSSGRLLVGTSTTSQDSTIVAQGSSGSASAILRLASSTAAPADGEVLGRLFFTASNHSASASVLASRDGGTWTAGTSQPSRLTFSTTADGASSPTERMRITNAGVILGGNTSVNGSHPKAHLFRSTETTDGAGAFIIENSNTTNGTSIFVGVGAAGVGYNASNCVLGVYRCSSNSRSINAAGSINASGADYAEYMTKAGDFTIAKGDVCGVDASGKLTNIFADSIGFLVKSTDPSYVGGDTWGLGFEDDQEGLEVARQQVDRIAFAGQVPVNITGATPGQYIVPVEAADGGIEGVANNQADLTLAEYMRAVGKVIAIEDDGRARIIVKVA